MRKTFVPGMSTECVRWCRCDKAAATFCRVVRIDMSLAY